MAQRTYLELSEDEGVSHKFYEVIVDGTTMTIRYGRIGTDGQKSSKSFASEEKALKEAEKKIKSKKRKGYEEAVMGVRQRRAITRRAITSRRSTAKKAPILWKFDTGRSAFGVFVDDRGAWVGNEAGRVFSLDHEGQVKREFKLPDGVKCIVRDDDWLYVGCDDGNVYDLTGKLPAVAYEIDANVDIYWLDIADGVLGVADAKGSVHVFNHEDVTQWQQKSSGSSGWMVRCDDIGVYHGHSGGVTMYDWEDGSKLWHQSTRGSVLFGWQEATTVYAGCSDDKVYRFTKQGEPAGTYKCDDSVFSCAATEDGKYVFAGDSSSSIYCFAQSGERLWKLDTTCGSAFSMQYHDGRVYIVTTTGALACLDAREEAIEAAQAGTVPQARNIKAAAAEPAVQTATSANIERTTDAGSGVVLECYKEGSKLRVRVVSEGYNAQWNVQFPRNLREAGARFVVDSVKESSRGGFYRAYGDIRKLDG